jgi:hypothetical protein
MRQKLLVLSLLTVLASTLSAATSSVKITMEEGSKKLPSVTATRLVMNDGTTKMYLLFAEKAPKDVVLVDATGNEGLTLGAWTTEAQTMAVKVSFVEGAHENYSLNVHNGAELIALGGHHSGDDGIRGPFKKLEIKDDTIRGTLQVGDGPATINGNFETKFNTLREPKPITGAAIAASPQGKALLGYANAMRKLDFVGANKYSVNDDSASLGSMDKKKVKELMKMEFGATAAEFEKLLATSAEMVGDGDEYHIRVTKRNGSSSSTSSFGIRNIGGVWKVNY